MGMAGIAMAAARKGGSAEVMRLRLEARELGLMEQELADEASRFVLTQQRLRYAFQAVKNAIASALLPAMREAADAWLSWYRTNREWLKLKLGEAVQAISRAFERISQVTRSLVDVFRWYERAVGSLTAGLTLAALAAGALVVILGLKKALLLLLVLLLEDFVTWLEGGESLIGELSERVKQLWRNFASGEIDFANHPILSLLRMIVRLIDTAIEGYQRFLNRLEGGGASLMDKALDK